MAKLLKTLCRELELDQEHQYYEYIIESKINGNNSQVRELFNDMKKDNKKFFLNDHLGDSNVDNEIRKMCIEELCL